jgi:hypothetical protein
MTDRLFKDSLGNMRTPITTKIENGQLHVSYYYVLEPGKTTLRGEYPKLAEPPKCSHPERLSCNNGEGFKRCEFMENINGSWRCQSGK